MRLQLSCYIVLGLFFTSQLNYVESKRLQEDELLTIQKKVENLIEKIINFTQDFHHDINDELKCIPHCVSEALMETVKEAICCVEDNEKDYVSGKITSKTHTKNFLKCLTKGKKEISDVIKTVNTTIDYCPDNVKEKTQQINVTPTPKFQVNITEGSKILKKEVKVNKDKERSFDGGENSTKVSEIAGSSKVDDDTKLKDKVTGSQKDQHGIGETNHGKEIGKPTSGKNLTEVNSNTEKHTLRNSTESDTRIDVNKNITEKSTKTTKVGHQQEKNPKGETSKKPNKESDKGDYTDKYDSELRSSSTENSRDVTSHQTVHHLH